MQHDEPGSARLPRPPIEQLTYLTASNARLRTEVDSLRREVQGLSHRLVAASTAAHALVLMGSTDSAILAGAAVLLALSPPDLRAAPEAPPGALPSGGR